MREVPGVSDDGGSDLGSKLSHQAYRRFKEALFVQRIAPGSILSQAELVAIVGVPIVPLREAIQILEADGLVQVLPRHGIKIAKADLAMLRNTYQLRQILEVPALRHAAATLDLLQLNAMLEEHETMLAKAPGIEISPSMLGDLTKLDHGFHIAIVDHLQNPLVSRSYKQALDYMQLIRADAIKMTTQASIARTMEEHRAILTACIERNVEAAIAALDIHFARSVQRSIGLHQAF